MTEVCQRLQKRERSIQLANCAPTWSFAGPASRHPRRTAEAAVRSATWSASLPNFAGLVPAIGGSLPPPNPC
jgi:hypothetical protein